jgi:hypothetical protein
LDGDRLVLHFQREGGDTAGCGSDNGCSVHCVNGANGENGAKGGYVNGAIGPTAACAARGWSGGAETGKST